MMRNPVILLFLYIFAMFQMQLLHYVEILSYVDELIVVWALYYILIIHNNKSFSLYSSILIAVIAVYGIYCNYLAKFQTHWIPITIDIINCFKIFVAYMGASLYFSKSVLRSDFFFFINYASWFNYVFVVIMVLFYFLNLVFNFGMSPDVRFGIPSYSFIYGGASKFSFIFYLIIPVLTLNYYFKRTALSEIFLFLSLLLWLSSLRSKVLVCVIIYLFLFYYVFIRKKRFKVTMWNAALGAFVAFLILKDQYSVYMDGESSARYYFIVNGFRTFRDYFPFGAGFGTFGTDIAAKYYSNLYYYYGMDNVYGLSPDNPLFSHDNYWPAIMGQFGAIGLALFVLLIYLYFNDIIYNSNGDRVLLMICVYYCVSQLIASLASPVFFSFMTVWQSFFLAFYINGSKKTIKSKTYMKIRVIDLLKEIVYENIDYKKHKLNS